MKKNEKKNEKKATIPKTTRWCPPLWHFLPGNNIRTERKEIIIMVIIETIMIIMIFVEQVLLINGRTQIILLRVLPELLPSNQLCFFSFDH